MPYPSVTLWSAAVPIPLRNRPHPGMNLPRFTKAESECVPHRPPVGHAAFWKAYHSQAGQIGEGGARCGHEPDRDRGVIWVKVDESVSVWMKTSWLHSLRSKKACKLLATTGMARYTSPPFGSLWSRCCYPNMPLKPPPPPPIRSLIEPTKLKSGGDLWLLPCEGTFLVDLTSQLTSSISWPQS